MYKKMLGHTTSVYRGIHPVDIGKNIGLAKMLSNKSRQKKTKKKTTGISFFAGNCSFCLRKKITLDARLESRDDLEAKSFFYAKNQHKRRRAQNVSLYQNFFFDAKNCSPSSL